MNYNGIECPVCNEKFNKNDDVVVCPVCGTPHHRNCWKNNGGCKNEEKHTEGFIWQMINVEPAKQPAFSQNTADLKTCPRCGEKNALYEPICTRCGERLKANSKTIHDQMPFDNGHNFGGYGENPNPNNFSPYQNVYAADARTVYGEDARIEDIPVTEVAEYVQKDSTKYIGKFLTMQEKKTKLSWNWSAGIFSVFWCFYRKMTGCGLALLAIFFSCYTLSSFVPAMIYEKFQPETYEAYTDTVIQLSEELANYVETGVLPDAITDLLMEAYSSPVMISTFILMIALFLVTSIVFGFFGNHFYKKKILKDIRSIRQVAVDSMSYHMYLRHRGGASAANVIVPVFIYMMLNMMMSYF